MMVQDQKQLTRRQKSHITVGTTEFPVAETKWNKRKQSAGKHFLRFPVGIKKILSQLQKFELLKSQMRLVRVATLATLAVIFALFSFVRRFEDLSSDVGL